MPRTTLRAIPPAMLSVAGGIALVVFGAAAPPPVPPGASPGQGTKAVTEPSRPAAGGLEPRQIQVMTEMDGRMGMLLYAPPAAPAAGLPAPGPPPAAAVSSGTPVILFSGEGGWRPIVQQTAADLAVSGRHVLGINSVDYFKRRLEADGLARDLATFVSTLNGQAGRPAMAPVILAGYSYGAEMVPYLVNRRGAMGSILGALLIAPDRDGAMVYRVSIQLKLPSPPEEVFDVAEEIARMPAMPVVLVQGSLDEQGRSGDLLPRLAGPRLLVPIVGGDHHFKDVRNIYLHQLRESLRWIEEHPVRASR
ncbi:MAG TPA: AcvB/VirJ family lysyl-phosphatidylglycerol hydrolase [Candidatus Polarisedimenticolia bacterium]|nr:AcvB/VirJ family lysyl-phosphatidylglycerol hydrolase [Candidatus Polarisedimenticolia bacterium]